MARSFGSRWWLLLVRGLAGIAFGLLTFIWPGSSLFALVLLFGAFAMVDGAFTLAAALSAEGAPRRGWMIFHGLAGLGAGVLTWMWPGISALVLLYIIAAWAIVTGVAEVVAGIRLRKQIEGEWLMILTGILSVAFGVLVAVYPVSGALAVTLWIGAYALVFGILMVFLSFKLRGIERHPERHVPFGGVPHPV